MLNCNKVLKLKIGNSCFPNTTTACQANITKSRYNMVLMLQFQQEFRKVLHPLTLQISLQGLTASPTLVYCLFTFFFSF